MPSTDPTAIDRMLTVPKETEHLEFKEAKSQFSKDKLVDYCVALGNEGGGKLILGVTDKPPRRVVGTQAFPDSTGACQHVHSVLRIRIDVETVPHPNGRVLVFHIPSRPRGSAFHHDGRYLMRVGEELLPMSPDQLARIFAENKPGFLEQIARSGVSAGDVIQLLDTQSYFDLFKLPYPAKRAGVLERFINEDLIRPADGVYDITRLCALLFAKNLTDFGVEIARKAARTVLYRGPGKLETVRDTTGIKGYAVGFKGLISHISTLLPSNEIIGEALRQTVRLYPSIAIRELVANALIHQDFEETGASVFIDIYSDRIEISNPGVPIVATERFIDGYRSRNERLADLMRRMNICEEKGSGVDKVIDAVEAHQLPAPDFRQTTNRTSVLLFAPVPFREMERLDRIRACYQHCCLRYVINQKMTNETLRQRFQLSEKQAETASRIIRETIREGRIKPENPDNASKRYMSYVPHWA